MQKVELQIYSTANIVGLKLNSFMGQYDYFVKLNRGKEYHTPLKKIDTYLTTRLIN